MPDDPNLPQPAMRLIFEYRDNQIQLVSQSPVTMVVPDADPGQASPGFYVDSRSVSDVALARVAAPAAFLQSAEVFPSQPDERIVRFDRPARGAFTVVVPAPEQAHHVTVVQIAQGDTALAGIAARAVTVEDGSAATAIDIAAFPLQRG